jgi:hypothetical protein
MSIENNGDNAPDNIEEDEALSKFDEATDKEMEEAGDDPAKLKELLKIRTASRQKLYNRLKDATKEKKPEKKVEKKPASKTSSKDDEEVSLDKTDRAILRSEGIKTDDEFELVQKVMEETGKDVEGVIASKYFQSELKSLRDAREVADATPGASKRSGQSTKNDVDWWIAKGQLPPHDQPALRQKVVNAKIAQERNKSSFSKNPIT